MLQALIRHGAHPDAARLLLPLVGDAELDGKGALRQEEALIAPVREAWGSLFTTIERQGTPAVTPPVQGGGTAREMIGGMSPEEINRSWPDILQAIRPQH